MDSDVNLLSRPPTAGLNTQCPCNPARITVEGKNLAPLYSQVDFPSPPPSPPALLLRQGRETIAAVFLFFPSGALAPSLIAILRPGARGAGWESQHANKAVQGFFLPPLEDYTFAHLPRVCTCKLTHCFDLDCSMSPRVLCS